MLENYDDVVSGDELAARALYDEIVGEYEEELFSKLLNN